MNQKQAVSSLAKSEFEEVIRNGPFPIRFPTDPLSQDKEWCEVMVDEQWRKIRFHDYAEVFKIPGLYETLFYRTLRCNSPLQVVSLLNQVLGENGTSAEDLRVLDLGAGNGMVGEALHSLGTRNIVGVDILPEARGATLRDRPWVYNEYLVQDFQNLSTKDQLFMKSFRFNTLTVVAALGFGDIPPLAFLNAFNLIDKHGWVAFNIKEDFLRLDGRTGFSSLLLKMFEKQAIRLSLYKRYRHRLNIVGQPLYYSAIVAEKLDDYKE